ncbi:hypothetical protein N5C80_30520, partial [Pseudomonas nicosulfuronedens]|nr:hypothetical protein [Pseudomonas nicosulfuronedens]MDH2030905.1 hypothetical protein [Pseudomonas nicosulfuronedens]
LSADSTDAVNGSQLFETNQNVTNLGDTINNFAGDQTTEYTEINGRGIRYVRTNDTGLDLADSSAQGQGSTAVGYNATSIGESSLALGREAKANNAGDVALGADSVTDVAVGTASTTIAGTTYNFAGTAPTSTVSVGSVGNERTITNVAAGRLSADSTDAVNGSQLFASNTAIDNISNNVDVLDKGAVKYDVNSDGTVNHNTITLAGDTYNSETKTGGTTITNVAAGVDGGDAVNVDQLNEMGGDLTSKGLNFAGNEGDNVHRDLGDILAITGEASTAGTYSGGNLKTVTDPLTGAIQLQMADAPKFGDVTINADGSGKITGLTAGTDATDAVNVSQLTSATEN